MEINSVSGRCFTEEVGAREGRKERGVVPPSWRLEGGKRGREGDTPREREIGVRVGRGGLAVSRPRAAGAFKLLASSCTGPLRPLAPGLSARRKG